VFRGVELVVRNLKLSKCLIPHLGHRLAKCSSFWVSVAAVPSSIRRFFEKLMRNMEFGFAVQYTMDLFIEGAISRDDMLERISELEAKFNKNLI